MGYHPYPAIDARGYADKIGALLALNAWATNMGQFNLLGSHDTARLRSIFGEDEAAVWLANLLLFTFPGPPSIYYGDEIGLSGGRDPASRAAFPWEHPETWNQTALAYHQQLIALRRKHAALRTGSYRRLWPPPDDTSDSAPMVYAFARQVDHEMLIVALNAGTTNQAIPLSGADIGLAGHDLTVLIGDADMLARTGAHLRVRLPPRAGCVLRVGD